MITLSKIFTVKSLNKSHQISKLIRFSYGLEVVFLHLLKPSVKVENEDVVGAAPTPNFIGVIHKLIDQ